MSPLSLVAGSSRAVQASNRAARAGGQAVHSFGRARSAAVGGAALGVAVQAPPARRRLNERQGQSANTVTGAALGGAGAHAAFLRHGYAIRAQGRAVERDRPEGMSRSAHQKIMREHHKATGVPNGTKPDKAHAAQFFRTYPEGLPATPFKHALGRLSGRRGLAINGGIAAAGTALGAGGAYGGTKMVGHANGRGRRQDVAKALYARERRPSPVRVLEGAAGLGLASWGLGRSPMLGRALARGVKQAGSSNNSGALTAIQLAQASQGALRRGTAPAERSIRQIRRVDEAINRVPVRLRPEIAAAAGILLAGHSQPLFNDRYRPVAMTGRVRGPGW